MKCVYAVLILCCAVHLRAQSMTPVTRIGFPELVSASNADLIVAPAPRTNFIGDGRAIPQGKSPTFDRSFAILAMVSAATMVADIELTANCMRTVVNCRELNPLLGSDPSRARLYGVNVPIYMSGVVLSRMLKRKFPERKLWMMPLLSLTGTHASGVASNMWSRR